MIKPIVLLLNSRKFVIWLISISLAFVGMQLKNISGEEFVRVIEILSSMLIAGTAMEDVFLKRIK